jgi:hypothetical protein
MASDFLYYAGWKSALGAGRPRTPLFFYAASDQLGRAKVGDTVWHVSLRPAEEKSGIAEELVLCGRLRIDFITTDAAEAHRRIAHYVPEGFHWEATHHAFARPGAEEPYAAGKGAVSIQDIAAQLRFDSERDRLTLADGRVKPQQLQTMRKLTPHSAALLRQRWENRLAALARGM